MWGHLLSFIGGPRACIGYRFSLVEYVSSSPSSYVKLVFVFVDADRPSGSCRMKALLFALVRAFEFELAVPAADIQKKSAIVQRPILRSAPEQGSQMPMVIRRYKGGA